MKKPLALITRPKKYAKKTATMLEKLSIESFIEPLIQIKHVEESTQHVYNLLNQAQGVIITSANAIKALDIVPKDFFVITVGPNTADEAKKAGFTNVVNANGGVNDLAYFIDTHFFYEDGAFIYACADVIYGNLIKQLEKTGFTISRVTVYNAIPIEKFTDECINLIKNRRINLIPLYSARSAEIFAKLVRQENIEQYMQEIHVFCLSTNIAEKLDGIKFKQIHFSANPNSESLLELISNFKFT